MGFLAALLILAQDVDGLVAKLGDDDPRVRDEATIELRKIGPKALDALRKAATSDDREVAARAKALIDIIDFPEPGAAVDGLAIAIKAEKEHSAKKEIVLRGRLINVTDGDLVLAGIALGDESSTFQLDFDAQKALHLCFRRKERFPDVPETVTLKKGEFLEFTFSPRAWCAYQSHSECDHLAIDAAGEHTLALTLWIPKAEAGQWRGTAKSNAVKLVMVD